jgi:hypothetical protein
VIGEQRDYTIDLLKPIADKCLGLVEGNHERNALNYYDRNIYRELARAIAQAAGKSEGDLMLGVQGYVLLRFRRHVATGNSGSGWTMAVYTHHGAGGGALPGGHALTLGRILGRYECDFALIGHRHVEVYISQTSVQPTPSGYRLRTRAGMFVPSYLRSHVGEVMEDRNTPIDTYAEMKMLPPGTIGTSPILIDPNGRQFHVTLASGGEGAGIRQVKLGELATV